MTADIKPQVSASNPAVDAPSDTKSQATGPGGGSTTNSGGWRNRRRGNRGRNSQGAGGRGNNSYSYPKFKGSCPELEGHVFDIGPNQAALFTRTQKEITAYASRKYSAEISRAIETLDCQLETIKQPKDPPIKKGTTELTYTQKEIIKVNVQTYTLRRERYEQGLRDMFMTVKGQCSEDIKQVLTGQSDYLTAERDFDTLQLLRIIQRIAYNHRADQYQPYAIMMAMKTAFLTRQGDDTSNADWFEQFKNIVVAVEACGGSFIFPKIQERIREAHYPGISSDQLTKKQKDNADVITRELSLATLYIMNSNRQRYGQLKQDLENDYLKGHTNYPSNMIEAQKLLVNYKGSPRNGQQSQRNRQTGSNDGVAFAQTGGQGPKSEARCWKCNKKGHLAYEGKCKPEDIAAFERLKQQ